MILNFNIISSVYYNIMFSIEVPTREPHELCD